jgi:hypothetical protein
MPENVVLPSLTEGSTQPDDHFIFSLVAGLVAGVPGAGLTVPCDVIKTRMQSTGLGLHASSGGTVPLPSLRSTVKALYNEGGVGAFLKGAAPRVGRVAPQVRPSVRPPEFAIHRRCLPLHIAGLFLSHTIPPFFTAPPPLPTLLSLCTSHAHIPFF